MATPAYSILLAEADRLRSTGRHRDGRPLGADLAAALPRVIAGLRARLGLAG